jgi:hypothetical protein
VGRKIAPWLHPRTADELHEARRNEPSYRVGTVGVSRRMEPPQGDIIDTILGSRRRGVETNQTLPQHVKWIAIHR